MDPILEALEKSNAAFAEFQKSINARLAEFEVAEAKAHGRPGNGGMEPGRVIGGRAKSIELNTPEVKAFARYMRTGDAAEIKSLNSVNANEGGYAVPKVIDSMIEEMILQQSPIRQFANVVQTSTSDYHKLVSLAGFGASWVAETAARPETAAGTFADVIPPNGDLYSNPQASQRMVDDASFNLEQWLVERVSDQFSLTESQAFISGDGSSKPKGFLSYTTATTDDTSRAFGTIQYIPTGAAGAFKTVSATDSPFDILMQTVAKLRVGYRAGARWYLAPSTLSVLGQTKDTQGRPILVPSITAGSPAMLVGYPVVECEDMPAIAGNSYSIAFANMQRAYLITDRLPSTRVLVDPFSNKPMIGYYCTRRTGGAVQNSAAIKLIKFSVS